MMWCDEIGGVIDARAEAGLDESIRRATTNGGIVVDAKTGAGTAGAITVRQVSNER